MIRFSTIRKTIIMNLIALGAIILLITSGIAIIERLHG